MMEILNYKRNTNKELLSDMNIELNRALIVLNDKHLKIRILQLTLNGLLNKLKNITLNGKIKSVVILRLMDFPEKN